MNVYDLREILGPEWVVTRVAVFGVITAVCERSVRGGFVQVHGRPGEWVMTRRGPWGEPIGSTYYPALPDLVRELPQ
jgi:hypothetical protein